MSEQIRPLAICLFQQEQRILVAEGYDPLKREQFYRPLGGGIEFGERGEETIQRELMEEIQAEAEDIRYLYTLENIFTFNGGRGHEIVMVYDGRLKDATLYAREVIEGTELDPFRNAPLKAVWKRLDEFGAGKDILYPHGLLENLTQKTPV